jgi:hypothetical protein
MNIAPIKTRRDYRQALKRIEGLMRAKRGTLEGVPRCPGDAGRGLGTSAPPDRSSRPDSGDRVGPQHSGATPREAIASCDAQVAGFDSASLQVNFGMISQADAERSMKLFAQEVMPHVSDQGDLPNHTFGIKDVSIGGADLATVLNRKCGD